MWLLSYDNSNALLHDTDYAAERAQRYLGTVPHPFTEVWVMDPATGQLPSHLESVWPSRDHTSWERRPPQPVREP